MGQGDTEGMKSHDILYMVIMLSTCNMNVHTIVGRQKVVVTYHVSAIQFRVGVRVHLIIHNNEICTCINRKKNGNYFRCSYH